MWYPTDETGACLAKSLVRGVEYEDFGCLYPAIGKTYFQWEYPGEGAASLMAWMPNNNWLPIVAVVLYGASIYFGQLYMKNRPAWDWRMPLAAWNLFLAVFSGFAFFRMLPHLLHNLYYYDFKTNFCSE